MADTAPIQLDVLQDNLEAQIQASRKLVEIVNSLADSARSESDPSASPAIAPQLQDLLDVSRGLSQSANTVAKEVVKTLKNG